MKTVIWTVVLGTVLYLSSAKVEGEPITVDEMSATSGQTTISSEVVTFEEVEWQLPFLSVLMSDFECDVSDSSAVTCTDIVLTGLGTADDFITISMEGAVLSDFSHRGIDVLVLGLDATATHSGSPSLFGDAVRVTATDFVLTAQGFPGTASLSGVESVNEPSILTLGMAGLLGLFTAATYRGRLRGM